MQTYATPAEAQAAIEAARHTNQDWNVSWSDLEDFTILRVKDPATLLVVIDGDGWCDTAEEKSGWQPLMRRPTDGKTREAEKALRRAREAMVFEDRKASLDAKKAAFYTNLVAAIGSRACMNPSLNIDGRSIYNCHLQERMQQHPYRDHRRAASAAKADQSVEYWTQRRPQAADFH